MVCFITAQLKLTLTEADLEHNEWTVSAGAQSRCEPGCDQ